MPVDSRWKTPVPSVSLPTYLFNSPTASLPTTALISDARDPSRLFLSKHSYRLWSQRFAAGLCAAGFQDGDRVLLFAQNSIFFPVVILGTIMAGGVFSGANPTMTPRELAHQLKDSGARFLIAGDNSLDTAKEAAKIVGVGEERVFSMDSGFATSDGKGRGQGYIRHWTTLVASEEQGKLYKWNDLTPDDISNTTVALNYSSGTTGVPKGVEITHKNYIANAAQMHFQSKLDPQYEDKKSKARLLCFLPMYHAYGQTVFCINSPSQDVPVYIMPKFDFNAFLSYIPRYHITSLTLVPPVVVALAKSPLVKPSDLVSVESVGCGAAPLGRDVCAQLEKRFPPTSAINVKQGWGMTEVTCSAMGWIATEHSEDASVGELNANCTAMIVGLDGKEVPRGERGEIWIRGPNVMKGYWNRPDATAETLVKDANGETWLRTGDVAWVNDQGKFYIVDRMKELIKVKGNQVAPAELEALLLEHPSIADAAVIGVTIQGDECPRAYVVASNTQNPPESNDIVHFVESQVSRHKRLTGGVIVVKEIPKNPSGKILRKVLREQASKEVQGGRARL